MNTIPQWLVWAREIQALSQTGLTYAENQYQVERYKRLMALAAEITAAHSNLPEETLLPNFMRQPGYATPKVDVRGAVIRDNKILLVQERSDERWCMPGGWADVGDIPSEMVAREVVEESRMIVRPVSLVGVYDANRSGTPLEFYHAYKLVFLCDILSGEPGGSDETLDARFFAEDTLPSLSNQRTDHRHLADVFSAWRHPHWRTVFD